MDAFTVFLWFFLLLSSSSLSHSNAIPYPNTVDDSVVGSSNTKPRLKPFNFEANILDGQTVRVFCQLMDGSQPLSFQWLKNGQPLSSSLFPQNPSPYTSSSSPTTINHLEIQTFHDYSSLAIYRVDRNRDMGNYTCLVSNSFGSDQHSSILIVQGLFHSSTSFVNIFIEVS
ncbi:hypothetical protein BLA29_007572 [Euroglyphus maynei]|uniref:Ig-like domain-containing protein n=1 Tax=Euroglyphus maynei TaxID=6958 RepID=A0A1Y3AVV6_EURMA|nr:hypothetical protein BLA29_007572 [Euroglyphus maynei]